MAHSRRQRLFHYEQAILKRRVCYVIASKNQHPPSRYSCLHYRSRQVWEVREYPLSLPHRGIRTVQWGNLSEQDCLIELWRELYNSDPVASREAIQATAAIVTVIQRLREEGRVPT